MLFVLFERIYAEAVNGFFQKAATSWSKSRLAPVELNANLAN